MDAMKWCRRNLGCGSLPATSAPDGSGGFPMASTLPFGNHQANSGAKCWISGKPTRLPGPIKFTDETDIPTRFTDQIRAEKTPSPSRLDTAGNLFGCLWDPCLLPTTVDLSSARRYPRDCGASRSESKSGKMDKFCRRENWMEAPFAETTRPGAGFGSLWQWQLHGVLRPFCR